MARTRRPAPKAPNGFVASAFNLPAPTAKDAGRPQSWQTTVWSLFDQVGELRFLATWTGNAISRAALHAAKRAGDNLVVETSGPGKDAMDALYGGPQGQSQMLQLLGVNLTVAGEGYPLWVSATDSWHVLASGKVTQDRSTTNPKVRYDVGDGMVDKTPQDLLMRIWTPHPREPKIADAPTRSNIGTLEQIVGYDAHITSQLTSRLTGAGILPLPSELEFSLPPDMPPDTTQAAAFMQLLHQTMTAAKLDPSGPAARVPIVITVPGDLIDKLPDKPIQFWTDLDEHVVEMREAGVKRFAVGMDAPAEVLTGNEDSNHWNAWLSEDAAIKTHLEPRLGVINHGLTGSYLRPALTGSVSAEVVADYFVIADTAEIRTRPNRSTDARELRDMGLLGDEATLREAGFGTEDAMTKDQKKVWLLERVAQGAITPELAAEALRMLGVSINPVPIQDPQQQPDQLRRAQEPKPLGPPDREGSDALAAACNTLVFRALERAGNKLGDKSTNGTRRDHIYLTRKGDNDALLAGTWDCAADALADFDIDVTEVVATLDFYVRGLLSQQTQHSHRNLALLLASWEHHDAAQK